MLLAHALTTTWKIAYMALGLMTSRVSQQHALGPRPDDYSENRLHRALALMMSVSTTCTLLEESPISGPRPDSILNASTVCTGPSLHDYSGNCLHWALVLTTSRVSQQHAPGPRPDDYSKNNLRWALALTSSRVSQRMYRAFALMTTRRIAYIGPYPDD